MSNFDVDRFVSLSRAVDLSDIDWEEAARVGITDDEHRVLRFMADTELHTVLYLRDLLAGHTAADPEVTQFMACWAYEETHHGRALERMLKAVGRENDADRFTKIHEAPTFREELTGVLSRMGARVSREFAGAHMCWGAINELTAAASYLALAKRSRNRPLAALVTKLARDERKHFAFYFHQSEKRILAGGWWARQVCKFTIQRFWEPVGIGVGEPNTLEFISSFLFGDAPGRAELRAIDQTIRRLPGMEWFDMVSGWTDAGRERFRQLEPQEYQRHRQLDEALSAELTAKNPRRYAAAL